MISVCIATYNGEKYIKAQIESILPQLSGDDEIIVSDDHSSDRTLAIVNSLGSPRIRVCVNPGPRGYTPNFENALSRAKGDYIFLSDQDDVWCPGKVTRCMSLFADYDFIISDASIIDVAGNRIADSFYAERRSRPGLTANVVRFSFLGCCIAFKRAVLYRALPFPPDHAMCTHDNWLTLVGMFFFKTVVIPDRLILYRRHGGNVSTGGLRATTSPAFKLRYRLYLLKWILLRALRRRAR